MKQANLRPLPKEDLEHCLTLTQNLWLKHKGARIFVTGGTGFFGKWLQETFAAAKSKFELDARMTVLTRDRKKAAHEMAHLGDAIEFVEGDLRTFPDLAADFTHVIHCATPVQGLWKPEAGLDTLDLAFTGCKRVLEFAVAKKARLLLVSSGAVYGPQPEHVERIPETYFGGPDSASAKMAYSEGKRISETLTHLYSQSNGLDHSIARCFAFVGPHMPLGAGFAAGDFLGRALSREPIEIKGDGTDQRSFMHAADLSVWLWTLLFEGTRNEIYNVGSGEAVSVGDLAMRISRLSSSKVEIRGTPGARPASRYVPEVSKAKKELGIEVRIGLDDALARTFNWLKS
ncbi:MAG: NAD-dependent epimerase/dehydratase family protein [Bdellovibrionota bacterium]